MPKITNLYTDSQDIDAICWAYNLMDIREFITGVKTVEIDARRVLVYLTDASNPFTADYTTLKDDFIREYR